MSGYGMPQGSPPGSTRSGRSTPALPVLELVGVGLAVLAFIVAFLAWAKADVPEGVDANGVSAKGWDLPLPTAGIVLLLVAAILLVAPLLSRRPGAVADADDATGPASPVPALLAVLGAVLLAVYAIKGSGELDRGIGTWLGLVLGLGTAAVLVLSWLQRTGRVKKAPAAGPSNWQGQQQGWGGGQPNGGYQQPQQPQGYGQPVDRPAAQPQPPAYGQQPSYGAPGGYPGPSTGGQPAQQPAPYGQEHYPPQSGGYPAQGGGYNPQG
jgi:Family of unknown function (DUF5336)